MVYEGNAFQPLGPETGLPRSEIVGFGEDQTGVLWVAGATGVFRQEKNQFIAVRGADGQPLQGVLCFKADANGAMWMGTRAVGLIRWRNGKMDRIGVEHGLPDCEVRGLIEDEQGYFWMASNRGIVRARRKQLHAVADGAVPKLEVQLLDQNDGLPSPECFTAQPNWARDTAGRLWFATQKGEAVIDPAEFRLNSQPPPVYVEQLTYHVRTSKFNAKEGPSSGALSGGEVRLNAPFSLPLRLPPGANGLELEFAALSFTAPEKARFQYQFEGNSPDWKDAGNDRLIRFHLLPPGEYVFRVRAANNDGVWNEAGASLTFSVLPNSDSERPQPTRFLIYSPVRGSENELAVNSRSMLQIMSAFASYLDVPEAHLTEHRALPALEHAAPETRLDQARIHSGKEKPANAFAAVQYRGHWFWIDDGDLRTKRALTAVMFFFTLAETGDTGKLPLITIPAQ